MSERAASDRKLYIAAIKVIAIFLVVFNHTGEQGFFLFSETQGKLLFPFYLFLSIFCKIAVPLFFMCSGALLLGKEEPLKRLFVHRILRFVVVIVLFSLVSYALKLEGGLSRFSLPFFAVKLYSSKLADSYWFLYSYLACLLMLPFLRSMARGLGEREIAYLIALQIAFAGVIPALEYLTGGGAIRINLTLQLIASNLFYMVIGYGIDARLDINRVKPRHIAALLAAGFVMLLLACLMTVYKGRVDGGYAEATSQMFHEGFIAIPTIAAFVLVKYFFAHVTIKPVSERLILYAGSLTFGIYLVHQMLMRNLRPIFDALVPAIRSLPATAVWVLATVTVSGVIAALLKRVPFLGKLL